jgi:hypothetical protein
MKESGLAMLFMYLVFFYHAPFRKSNHISTQHRVDVALFVECHEQETYIVAYYAESLISLSYPKY